MCGHRGERKSGLPSGGQTKKSCDIPGILRPFSDQKGLNAGQEEELRPGGLPGGARPPFFYPAAIFKKYARCFINFDSYSRVRRGNRDRGIPLNFLHFQIF